MSTHTEPVDCPNCGVSAHTELAQRIDNRDEDGTLDYVHCDLCGHTDPLNDPNGFVPGEQIDPADVPDRARALLTEQGWEEEDLDLIESFVAGDDEEE
jgi:hypothetical protein